MKLQFVLISLVALLFTFAQDTTTIAMLGCHNQNKPAPSISFIANELKPDYAVWLGDNVYADTETDPMYIQQQLNILASKPGFKELKENTPFFVTWDDHDYGLNNANKTYIFKQQSKKIHRTFWELEDKIPANRDGVYYDEIVELSNGKKIQFIMIDGRYNLDPPKTKNRDNLGEKQWEWLAKALHKKADIRFVVSGYQVLLPKLTRWESWAKVGKTRQRLFNIIEQAQANNVVFLTGDQHTTEILQSQRKLDYFTYEIMACGINKTERPGRAPNRVMGPDVTVHSAPVMDIYWGEPNTTITFSNYNAETKKVVSSFQFKLTDIGMKQ